ncbi:DUF1298 domain-containing protein [Rhodococcus chondri]|uniref:DUF1298 domain-containing protein n=1 Tax=Rhodococcus chondri TaxID=3065941 RepID=A0ABU7JLX8_9NOCA|nr:DUF1298 domain-containing protein [Rhodococcus sp. CC-R104]MEE2031041.1 DUF1298 domain-containing protein [Rhodococcus sp. CC-R104]
MLFRDWRQARLSWADAGNYHGSTRGLSTDSWSFVAFAEDQGRSPGHEEIREYFDGRLKLLSTLARRVVDAPAGLDYPYWVRTDMSVDDVVAVYDEPSRSFDHWLDQMAQRSACGLDSRQHPWRIHVFPGVPAPVGTPGAMTVVVVQASHAMLVGASLRTLFDTLFAPDARPLVIEGLPPPAIRPHPVAAAAYGLVRASARSIPAAIGLVATRRALRSMAQSPGALPGIAGQGRNPIPDRHIRVIHPDLGRARGRPRTVTVLGLTAVSFALERYYHERDEPYPALTSKAAVPVALGEDAGALGVNRLARALVDLHLGVPDMEERMTAIEQALAGERARASSPTAIGGLVRNGREAYPWHRRELDMVDDVLRAGTVPSVKTVVSSVNCGADVQWSLPWGSFRFTAGVPSLAPGTEFLHTFIRAGDAFAVTVMGRLHAGESDGAARVDRYVELLRECWDGANTIVG